MRTVTRRSYSLQTLWAWEFSKNSRCKDTLGRGPSRSCCRDLRYRWEHQKPQSPHRYLRLDELRLPSSVLAPLMRCADHQMYSRNRAKRKKGRGKNILDRIALQPRLTGLQPTRANSSPFLSHSNHSFLGQKSVQQAGAYLGLNTLIKFVIFEGERILVLLRTGSSHVAFLGTHHQISSTISRCSL